VEVDEAQEPRYLVDADLQGQKYEMAILQADEFIVLHYVVYPDWKSRDEKIRYSQDVDALLIELSTDPIAYAEDEGEVILHYCEDAKLVV